MANTPLRLVRWEYNDDNAARPLLVGIFREGPTDNHPDLANFYPSFEVRVEVPLPNKGAFTPLDPPPPSDPSEPPAPAPTPPDDQKPQATKRQTPLQVERQMKREGIAFPDEEAT